MPFPSPGTVFTVPSSVRTASRNQSGCWSASYHVLKRSCLVMEPSHLPPPVPDTGSRVLWAKELTLIKQSTYRMGLWLKPPGLMGLIGIILFG